ncbi:MAG: hypothetical protein JOS17DRAFT_772713 [Linnemannia elongata]|nr:MAG: hypothetical protein JOS17DRAFT_772713 [Linnemannia elongata]
MNYISPVSPPKGPQDRSLATSSSLVNPHTQPVEQEDPYQQQHQQQQYDQKYPEPELVDTTEKVDHNIDDNDSTPEKNSGKRKRLYWIACDVITIIAGVLIGLIVSMRNKDSANNNSGSSNNSALGNGTGSSGS